jgi:RNA polymerase sigma-70 factor (ECF subfamily)
VAGPDGEEFELQIPDEGPGPDTVLERREAVSRLEEVIADLPPHYKAITLLRHQQQLSYEEIAEVLQLPLGTVKARIHRARAQIQQMLADRSYDI